MFGKKSKKSPTEIQSISLYIVGGLIMKKLKNKDLNHLESDLKESWRIEEKMLKTTEQLTSDEIEFLRARAESGVPLGEFSYGLYYLLYEQDEKTAEEWWNKFFYNSNGFGLWKASGIFAYLGEQYYEWSMKCLRRSAWRQFKLSKMMLKDMKANPFKFPEA